MADRGPAKPGERAAAAGDDAAQAPQHRRDCVIIPAHGSVEVPEEQALQEIRDVPDIQGATGKGIWVAIGRAIAHLRAEVNYQKGRKHSARNDKERIRQEREELRKETERQRDLLKRQGDRLDHLEQAHANDVRTIDGLARSNRRQFLFMLAGVGGVVYLERYRIAKFLTDKIAEKTGNQKPDYPPVNPVDDKPIEERRPELFKRMTPFETVLSEGLREFDPERGIWTDRLLSSFKLSEYLLGDKFIYTGIDEALSSGQNAQNVHTFAIMGEMSRRFGRNGNHKDAYKTTTLCDTINTLIDYRRLSDDQIKEWIVYTYYHSFGVTLVATNLTVERNKTSKRITNVSYDLQAGNFNEMRILVPKTVEDLTPDEKGGNITQVHKTFPLVGANNRLLLHSGISPVHDLRVPASYMEVDKDVNLEVAGIHWPLKTSDLADTIRWYKHSLKTVPDRVLTGTSNGRTVGSKSILPHLYTNDPFAKILAEHLTKSAKTDAEKIQKITTFVQSLRYIWENNSDRDRPILITLFNDGSDCNNLVVAWASMMHALNLDYALLHTGDGKDEAHTMGGIPEDTAPPELKSISRYRGIFPVELTGKWEIGRVDPPPRHQIFAQEVQRFPKPQDQRIEQPKK